MTELLDPDAPCIETTWPRTSKGYGRSNHVLAHRRAYCQANNVTIESIAGQLVRHTCDNPPCVNPKHLLLGDYQDNYNDMASRDRVAKRDGENNPCATLSWDIVNDIRKSYVARDKEFGGRPLARKFGVSESTVSLIMKGKIWPIQTSSTNQSGCI